MDEGKTVLITGTNGQVGHRACEYLIQNIFWTIIGTSARTGLYVNYAVDLTDIHAINHLHSKVRPDVVIHTTGITRSFECEKNRELYRAINVDATRNLASIFTESRFIYFSTMLYMIHLKEEVMRPVKPML
jgi:dTDP-4-dehydrorhamnose reductase